MLVVGTIFSASYLILVLWIEIRRIGQIPKFLKPVEALNVNLYAPDNNSNLDYDDVTFICNVTDDTGIKNVSLYSNISGSWDLIETKNTTSDEYEYNSSFLVNKTDLILPLPANNTCCTLMELWTMHVSS